MTFFSTILNSNHAGRKGIIEDWLRDHRFFIGAEEEDVGIVINNDLSISIDSNYRHEELYPDLTINEIPPYGIKEIRNYHEVALVNLTETDINKLPKFKHCKRVNLEYCTLPKEYINDRMITKYCTLV